MLLRRTFLLLITLAVVTAQVAATPTDGSPLLGAGMGLLLAGAAGLAGRLPRLRDNHMGKGEIALAGFALLSPWGLEAVRNGLALESRPLELLFLEAAQNLLLALAALSRRPLLCRLAAGVSLFVVLFASALGEDRAVLKWLLVGYVAVATLWLVLLQWQDAPSPGRGARRPHWPALASLFLVVGLFAGLGTIGPMAAAQTLGELFHASGGTGEHDPAARGGLNDGDDEVAGENARSSGFIDSDIFIEDERPSLYDVANDQFGEAIKPREQERTIALSRERTLESDQPPAENLRPRREFSTSRQGPRQARDPGSNTSEALFFVVGRTPLHLRMNTHDVFDGVRWVEAAPIHRTCLLEADQPKRSGWMQLYEGPSLDLYGGAESHQLRFVRLKSHIFPTPEGLTGFRMGKVEDIDFFGWEQEGVLRFRHRPIAAGMALQTERRSIDPRKLIPLAFPTADSQIRASQLAIPPEVDRRVHHLASDWAGDAPRGWLQIERVIRRLREHAEVDPLIMTPPECRDSVGHFLFHSRRGPNYQFASAAAILLRCLGYSTRLVTGFYANPTKIDPYSRQTPVLAEDIHVWPEVQLPGNVWMVLEPTPGYEAPAQLPTWREWVWQAVSRLGAYLQVHARTFALGGLGLASLFVWRRMLMDRLGLWLWWYRGASSWHGMVLQTLWLLERRSRWAGLARPPAVSPRRWLRQLDDQDPLLSQLAGLVDRAAYSTEPSLPLPLFTIRTCCWQALRAWNLRRFQRHSVQASGDKAIA